jgi:aryl-alcohol dehydrogenase-like predicted oxidoreductase
MTQLASRRAFLGAALAGPAARRPSGAAGPALQYRTLGSTGLKVTSVGFGCMITSDASVIEKAAEIGINFFDTARSYQGGNNERMVGAALRARRRSVLIGTKTRSADKASALEDLNASLRELRTDYVDIWYLHGRSRPEQITDELVDAFATAKRQGKIRFAGVSTHSSQKTLIPALAKNPHIDVILTAYNFTMDAEMGRVIEQARQAGKAIVAMKVMAGRFTGVRFLQRLEEKLPPEGRMLAALKWVLRNPHVDTTIPSIADLEQLEENLRAMSEPFTDADGKLLAWQSERIRPLYCRMCGACDGRCPKGLPVSDILRYLSYADGYGEFALARESFLELPEPLRAIRCRDCAVCAIECPNGVQVAARLARAQETLA